jgi:origin recognition complex subunit 6
MNRSIEQALLSLLPTHNSALTLPKSLTDLASSLLAQSRNRASTLKAEEEIARPYACAHLACDRLKTSLNLPTIDPRPPVPPRIYKRLFNHLDNILAATAATPSRNTPLGGARVRTPSSKLREQNLLATSPLATKSRGPPSRTTPSKEKSLADLRSQTTAGDSPSRKRTTPHKPSKADALPAWIRPTLRFLLTHLGPAPIGPIVASGLESIIAPAGKLTDDVWVLANLVPVLGALYLYVWRGLTWPDGQDVDRERYVKFRKEVASCLAKARQEVELAGGDEGWEGWTEVGPKNFDEAAVRGNRHGWFEMEWVEGVGDLADRERDAEDEREGGDGGEEVVQIRRADTMFQERYNYLGERKRKAYAEWKGGMLKRIKELEAR